MNLCRDHFQNYKRYNIPKAQLIIADIPFNIGINAYASNPSWYKNGDNKNGESELAGKTFFDTDKDFRIAEFMHFVSTMLKKEPKEKSQAGCMIVFCEFEQQFMLIEKGKEYGFNHYINLVFRKNYSAQVLKANMKVVGNCEYAVLLYRDKLPKFRNEGKMIFNCMDYVRDTETPKIHPCLPTGEKVFANNKWINIEDVKKGDCTNYGVVIETSTHEAEKIIAIKSGGKISRATYNHPFLVKRGDNILWLEAENVRKEDYLLTNLKLQTRDILESEEIEKQKCYTFLFGKKILEKFPRVIRSIIKMMTKRTIELKTSSLLTPLHISGCTVVASCEMEYGTSLVKLAGSLRSVIKKIGILAEVGLMGKNVDCAISKEKTKSILCGMQKVENTEAQVEKTTVHNLSIKGVPAFDARIGISHNTQKSIHVIKNLINIFTDVGDVVIDPCAGSGVSLLAAEMMGRKSYGFEIKKEFVDGFNSKLAQNIQVSMYQQELAQKKYSPYAEQVSI